MHLLVKRWPEQCEKACYFTRKLQISIANITGKVNIHYTCTTQDIVSNSGVSKIQHDSEFCLATKYCQPWNFKGIFGTSKAQLKQNVKWKLFCFHQILRIAVTASMTVNFFVQKMHVLLTEIHSFEHNASMLIGRNVQICKSRKVRQSIGIWNMVLNT